MPIAPDEISVADPRSVKVLYGTKSGFSKTEFYFPLDDKHGASWRQLLTAGRNEALWAGTVGEQQRWLCLPSPNEQLTSVNGFNGIRLISLESFFMADSSGFLRDEHDFGNYIPTLDSLLPAVTVISVLPAFLRTFQPILGPPVPSMRRAVRGFDELRDAAKFWDQHRMQEMEN
ncbi:hypothetical protein BDV12DRAFT_202305 [Aspergillus spectabilis]